MLIFVLTSCYVLLLSLPVIFLTFLTLRMTCGSKLMIKTAVMIKSMKVVFLVLESPVSEWLFINSGLCVCLWGVSETGLRKKRLIKLIDG